MAHHGRVSRWLLGLLVLATAFAGCFGAEPVPPGGPDTPRLHPEGPGWVRVLESGEATAEAQLFGFSLELHADDWKTSDLWSETRIAIAPFGNLTGWAVFLFEDGRLAWEIMDLPYDRVDHQTGERSHHGGAEQPALAWIFSLEPARYDAVVALFGAGGLALAPDPDWPLQELPGHEELLAMTAEEPNVIGTGTGMVFDAYIDFTHDVEEGMRLIYGKAEATYRGPLPTDGASPLLDARAVVPASLVGWASTVGIYQSDHAVGAWAATIDGDATHDFGGLVVQEREMPVTRQVGETVFGRPLFLGYGATGSPTVTEFQVNVAGADTRELFGLQQASFGVPLERLIGIEANPFETQAFDGLVAPTEFGYTVRGTDLVLDAGAFRSMLVGVVPTASLGAPDDG